MGVITQENRLIAVETSLGDDAFVLTSMQGYERLSAPFVFTLTLFANRFGIDAEQLLGQSISWWMHDADETRYFNGVAYQVDVTQTQGMPLYVVEVRPWLSLLDHAVDCRIFQDKTTQQIVQDVFAEVGFNDYQFKLNVRLTPRPYCVQYNETALHFVSRLLAEEGIFYFFQHQRTKHTLILSDNKSAYVKMHEKDLTIAADSAADRCIGAWQRSYKYATGEIFQTDYDFTAPTSNLLSQTTSLRQYKQSDKLHHFIYPGNYRSKATGDQLTKMRMQAVETQQYTIQAQSNYRSLGAGTCFSVDGQNYVIYHIQHHAEDNTHTVGYGGAQRYTNSFTCLPTDSVFRPAYAAASIKPTILGAQTAVVVGADNEEIYSDKYGRIKVQFMWDRYGKRDEKSSCWLRVAQIWAGKQWGSLYIPRVGDEVVVNFLNGDPDNPIVIGSVYNANQMPPYNLPEQKTRVGVKTHSSKQGQASDSNELSFDDKKEQELFYMHAQKDRCGVVENDDTLTVKHDSSISVENDYTVQVNKGNYTQTIAQGARTVSVNKDDKLDIKQGTRTVNLAQGSDNLTLSQGSRTVKITMGDDSLSLTQGNHSIAVTMGKSTVTALQGIEFIVGANSVKIDQAGVNIQGMIVRINGQTMTQINAGALLQLKGGITMIN